MLKDLKIGLAVTGSFCNFSKIKPQIDMLKSHGISEILPIASYATLTETNRFSRPEEIQKILIEETGKEIIDTISKAEPIGPKNMVDLIVIAPCTGNTLAKLKLGITDTGNNYDYSYDLRARYVRKLNELLGDVQYRYEDYNFRTVENCLEKLKYNREDDLKLLRQQAHLKVFE